MANGAASLRSGAGCTHGSDVLFPSAGIPLLTGLAKGAILRRANRLKVPCDLLATPRWLWVSTKAQYRNFYALLTIDRFEAQYLKLYAFFHWPAGEF
jgi:hypothetical protein